MTDFFDTSKEEKREPFVSIIINCYNGEQFLRQAIDSVLAQTYKNFEVIFWDNQSTDNSAKIIISYTDVRLKYFYASRHTSLYMARNFALRESSGEFIAFLDVDDWWSADKLEKQIPLFNDQDVGLVYGNFWLIDVRKKKSKRIAHDKILPEGRIINQLLDDYSIGLLTIIIRRTAILNIDKAFNSHYQIIGDFDLAIRLALQWKFSCIQSPLAFYRWHGRNLSKLESEREFIEFKSWYSEIVQHPIIGRKYELTKIHKKIYYLEIMHNLMQGERLRAIYLFTKYPFCTKKIKLFFAILIPLSVIRALRA